MLTGHLWKKKLKSTSTTWKQACFLPQVVHGAPVPLLSASRTRTLTMTCLPMQVDSRETSGLLPLPRNHEVAKIATCLKTRAEATIFQQIPKMVSG